MKAFVHIPRTGGTALLQVFRQWYGKRLFTYYNEKPFNEDEYDIIFGHKHFDLCEYILFLREPYEQQLSYYNYTKSYTEMPSVDDYFRSNESMMVKFLPPMEYVVFVGIYERYNEDVKRLADFLRKGYVAPQKVNVSIHKHIPSNEAKAEFVKNNEYIYKIYNNYL